MTRGTPRERHSHKGRERTLASRRRHPLLIPAELVDARGARPDFSPAQLRSVVAQVRRLAAETGLGKTAIVVDSELAFGMLRMLQILVDDVCTIRPFRDHEKAEQWLADCNAG